MENRRNNKKTAIIIILFLIGVVGLVALMIGLLTKFSSNNKPDKPVVDTIEVEDNQTTIYNGEENAPIITSKLSDTDIVTYEYSLKTSDSYDNLDFNEGLPSNAGIYWIKIYLNSIEKKVVTYTIEKANPVAEIVKVKYVQNNYFTTDYLVSDLTFDSEFYFNSEIVEGIVKLDEEELKPSISTYHYTFTPNNENFNNVKGEVDILVYASVYLYKGDELYDVLEVPYNSLFEVDPFEARDGYSAPYWVDNAGNTYDENTFITDDVSLVFTEDLIEYNVIYNLDGGSNDSKNPQKFTVLDDIELLAPSKNGYNFEGWYLDKEFENIVYSISNKFENIELYAKFTIVEYSITYVLDGGTNDSNNPTKITIEDKIQLMDPTKYGYNFEGWYLNNELVEELSTVSTNIELYAKFSIGTYTISFNTVGGEQLDSITQEYNSELFLPTSVEKRGYTFVAWYYDEAYTKLVYKLFNMPGEDLTLYAKWNINPYNITYNLNDGDNNSNNPHTYTVEDTIELLDATKTGYTFTGWTLNGEAITAITNMIGNIELVANFAINQYTIQFEENDGELLDDITVDYNTLVELPNANRLGYEFNGWYKEDTFVNRVAMNYTVLDNITLYAKWTLVTYDITYVLNDGTNGTNPTTYTILDTIELEVATKTGYTFTGWTLNGEPIDTITNMTGDLELVANYTINQYTIQFVENGGDEVEDITADYDSAVTIPSTTKTGYDFVGWYYDQDLLQPALITRMPLDGTTLYAKWNIVKYNITYILNGGTNGVNPTEYTIEDTIELKAAEKTGYTFGGWSLNNTPITEIKNMTGDIELMANYTINPYTITFVENGGEVISPVTRDYNTTITLPETTRTGYTFVGWYSDELLNNRVATSYTILEDVTLYAKWNIVTYEITYVLDGGTNGDNPASYNVENTITLEDATKTGYTFVGWTLNGEPIDTITNMTGDLELVANYEAIEYTITYVLDGGTNGNNPVTYTIEDTITLEDATKTGYDFVGWYDGEVYVTTITNRYGNIELKAIYEIITYEITYVLDGGTNNSNNPTEYNVEDTITLEDATKTGYTFTGWTLNGEAIDTITNMTGDLELVANFTINQYTITFEENGGAEVADITADYNSAVTLPEITKRGYTFGGWYIDSGLNTPATITKMPVGGATLYAKWNIVTYEITYVLDGGTNGNNPLTYTVEDTITLEDAEKLGYTFTGWTLADEAFDTITNSIGNLELVANYTPNTNTKYYVRHMTEELDGSYELYIVETLEGTTDTLTNASAKSIDGFTAGSVQQVNIDADQSAIVEIRYTRNSYAVTFIYDSGLDNSPYAVNETIVEISVKYEDKITTIPVELAVNKYEYSLLDELDNIVTADTVITSELTVKVVYVLRELSIVFYNTVEAIPTIEGVLEGQTVTLPSTSKTGYTFDGWATEQNGSVVYQGNEEITMPSTPLDLYAVWTINQYTIQFEENGGVEVADITADYNSAVTLPETTKRGYTFGGWYTDSGLNTPATITKMPVDGATLYAKWNIVTYNITYTLNGGSNTNPATYTVESNITLADSEKNGYTFTGWTLNGNAITEISDMIGDITLVANFEINNYEITYVLNGGTNGDNPTTYTIEDTITLEDATKTGYDFVGWYDGDAYVTTISNRYGNIELTAIYEIITYEITYVLNGGTNGANPATYTVEDTITLEDATKTGYTFTGWTLDNQAITTISNRYGDITLTANFTINQYTITFEENGGAEVADITADYNSAVALPETTKRGYTFGGWYTDSGLNTPATITKMPVDGATLYAKWNIVTYNITYTLNGGSNTNPATYTVESNITLADSEKNGYTFTGWTLNGNAITEISDMIGDITLVANFEINNYEITYVLNGGTNSINNPATYTVNDDIVFEAAKKNGYTFNGWFLEEGFNTPISEISLGSTGNKTLYAKFTAISYTITYVLNGGTNTNPTTYTIEDTIELANSEKIGYTFTGWTLDNQAITTISNRYGDITLTANFTINQYTIQFEENGGAEVADITADYNSAVTLPETTKRGYTFGGWYTDSGLNTPATITKMPVGGATLYAKWNIVTYNITYTLNGGINGANPTTYTVEDTIELAVATKTGYTFTGWTLNDEAITTISNMTGNITLVANYTIDTYTITYVLNGGTNNSNNPASYNVTDSIVLADATKTGYTFNGWYTDSGFNNSVSEIAVGTTGNKTFYAKFTAISYTITYVLDGGTNDGNNPVTYTTEDTITLEDASKTGYTFTGWTLDNQAITTISNRYGDITLTANFTINQYTITFEENGGVEVENITADYNSAVTLPETTKRGYTFGGWYTDSGLNTPATITKMPVDGATLYAKWNIVTYNITYTLNGGSNTNPATYTVESNITLQPATKNGYTFTGWTLDGNAITEISDMIGNITLVANYTIDTYSITYVLNGGTNNSNNPASYNVTDSIVLADATKTGYTFNGWYTDSGFNNSVSEIAIGTTGNKTFYAKFTAISYTITYVLDGGTNDGNNPATYTVESNITLQPATKDDYAFIGWYTESSFTNQVSSIPTGSTGNKTFYAKFEFIDNSHTITYVLNGGTNSANNPAFFNPEMGVITLENPTKGNAYTFGGWYLDSSFTNRIIVIDCENTDENLTLYAKWNAVKYTIIYYDGEDVITSLTPTSYTADDTVTLPTYNKFNHTFGGWYTEATFINRITTIQAGTTGTIKLYAKTTDKGFTVKFYDVDGTTLLDTKTTTTYGSVTAPSYSYDSNTYHFTWVNKATGEEVDLTSIDASYNLKAQLVLISYTATIYYTDADGYATTARSNAILASVENTNLTFGDTVNLSRQMRITNASTYDFFYMSPVAAFDWSYAVAAVAKAAAYTNADGTISCIVETDGTNGTLIIIVYCIQPVAIITSSSQTLAYSENTNMSTSTYQFYKTIDEAFDVYSTSSGKLLRIYGRQGAKVAANCLTPHANTTIAAKSTTLGSYTITRPKLIYSASDYTLHNSYTINSNILLPYYRSCTDTTGYRLQNTSAASANYVHSVLVIDQNVTLTLSTTLNVGGDIVSGSSLYGHGVIMNNGTIIAEGSTVINSYGFIKGTGNLIINPGTTLVDYFKIYDWPGGANGMGLYNKNIFPFECYSFHNVSCNTRIYSGATYKAWNQLYMASTFVAENITLIGTGGLFQLTSGYIDKSIEETTTALETNTKYSVSNHNQTVKDVLDIHGNFSDNTISIKIKILGTTTVSTSTSMALPIGFMTVKISEGTGTLKNNSYKFLPGSKLEICKGANAIIDSGVKVIIYDEYPDDYTYKNGDTTQSGATNPYSYQNKHSVIYTNGLVNEGYSSQLIVNGTLVVKGNLGGKIYTTDSTGSINLSNKSATLPKPTALTYGSTGSSCTATNETINAQIYLLNNNSFAWSNAEAATYSAVSYNGEYGWTKNTNVTSYAVTYNINGQTSQVTINTTGSSYTFVESDLPTVDLDGYIFGGWYTTNSYTTEALGYTITANQTLYAKLTPIIYSIEYEIAILDDYDETQPMINNNVTYFTFSDTVTFTEPTCGDLNFTGWFVDNNYSVNAPNITSSTLQYYKYLIDETNTIHLYGYFSSIAYYTVIYRNSEGIEIESIPSERIRAGESITIAAAMPSYQDTESIDTTLYAYKMINFSKWYVIDSGAHIVAQLNPGDTYTPTSSVNIVPYFVDGLTYVSITPGSLSDASYTVTYSGGSGSSNATFYVPKGTALTFTVSYTYSDNRSFTYTPASGSASTSTSQTANYNATVSASSEDSGCVAPGTLITMADGSKQAVENLSIGDLVLTWNFFTGQYEVKPIIALEIMRNKEVSLITVELENGISLEIINYQSLFDTDLMRYFVINSENYNEFIGTNIAVYTENGFVQSRIVNIYMDRVISDTYEIITANNFNFIANDILTVEPFIFNVNLFTINENFMYDSNEVELDIATYGLFTYDEWKDYLTEEEFNAFNGQFFKIAIAKGLTTVEHIFQAFKIYNESYLG